MSRLSIIAIVLTSLVIGCDSADNDLALIGTQWGLYQNILTPPGQLVTYDDLEDITITLRETGRVRIGGRLAGGVAAYTMVNGQPVISDWGCLESGFYCSDVLCCSTEWRVRGDELEISVVANEGVRVYYHRALTTPGG